MFGLSGKFVSVSSHHAHAQQVVNWGGLLLCAAALLLYLATLDNGLRPGELEGGDLITHQYAQVQGRPGNAPGYPLYTMGGWLWFHTLRTLMHWSGGPDPNPIPLLSSYSTLWAVLALWLFYHILCRLSRSLTWPAGNWPLAALLSLFYAVTFFFWYYATTTEQYSSAIAQTLAIVYVYLLWQEEGIGDWRLGNVGATAQSPIPNLRKLLLLAFLCGLTLAHMLTVALIVPPLVIVMLWQAPGLLRSLRVWGGVVGAALLPLVSYIYVYIRGALHPEWWGAGQWHSAQEWFWAFLSTAQGREELGWGFEAGRNLVRGVHFPELIWQELTIPLLLLGLLGIAALGRKLAGLLYGTLGLYLLFCWAYRYGNWYQVILPAYPLVLLGVVGSVRQLAALSRQAGKRWLNWRLDLVNWGFLLLLGGAVGGRFVTVLPAANSRNQPDDTAFDQAAQLLAQPLPAQAALFANVQEALALQYLITIWQVRPDLQVVSSPQAAQLLSQGRPVLATWPSAALLQSELPATVPVTRQSAAPDWVAFQPSANPQPLVSPKVQVQTAITPGLTLVGYSLTPMPTPVPQPLTPTAALDVMLFWEIEREWPADLAISVRPLHQGAFIQDAAQAGQIIQVDRTRPSHDLLLLAARATKSQVADGYRLPLPAGIPSAADGVMVILYQKTESGFRNVAEIQLERVDRG